jgi:hypothetical protein
VKIGASSSVQTPRERGRSLTAIGAVRIQRLVVEAERFREVVEVRVLEDQVPVSEIGREVAVRDGDLHSPIILVVHLHVPVDLHGAHVRGAVQEIRSAGRRRWRAGATTGAESGQVVILCAPVDNPRQLGQATRRSLAKFVRMRYSRINAELLSGGGRRERVVHDGGVRRLTRAGALGAGDDRVVVERRERDAARRRCHRLRVAARHVPCHCDQNPSSEPTV